MSKLKKTKQKAPKKTAPRKAPTKTVAKPVKKYATTFLAVMAEFADAFETRTRDSSGEKFTALKDGAPTWLVSRSTGGARVMLDVHQAIDGRFPDDWVYESTASITYAIANDYNSATDADSARDVAGEIADSQVDVYTSALVAWLASNGHNSALCDEAVEELCGSAGLVDDGLIKRISMGQCRALSCIAEAVINAVEAEADRRDSEAE